MLVALDNFLLYLIMKFRDMSKKKRTVSRLWESRYLSLRICVLDSSERHWRLFACNVFPRESASRHAASSSADESISDQALSLIYLQNQRFHKICIQRNGRLIAFSKFCSSVIEKRRIHSFRQNRDAIVWNIYTPVSTFLFLNRIKRK